MFKRMNKVSIHSQGRDFTSTLRLDTRGLPVDRLLGHGPACRIYQQLQPHVQKKNGTATEGGY